MATIDVAQPIAQPAAAPAVPASGWGNAAPLGLAGFAVTTFMLSMINAKLINVGVEPVVFGVALMFGGIAQLIAGTIQFRNGSTFTGVLFTSFGAFWLSLYAIAEFFLKDVPRLHAGRSRPRAVPVRVRHLRGLALAGLVPHQRRGGRGPGPPGGHIVRARERVTTQETA